jgi:hypothetical protein
VEVLCGKVEKQEIDCTRLMWFDVTTHSILCNVSKGAKKQVCRMENYSYVFCHRDRLIIVKWDIKLHVFVHCIMQAYYLVAVKRHIKVQILRCC